MIDLVFLHAELHNMTNTCSPTSESTTSKKGNLDTMYKWHGETYCINYFDQGLVLIVTTPVKYGNRF